jgi:hypothetical protein
MRVHKTPWLHRGFLEALQDSLYDLVSNVSLR